MQRNIQRGLFAESRNYRMHDEAKRFIEQRMVEMVRDGSMYLTEVMLQPEANTAGEALFGLGRDENLKIMAYNWPTAPDLVTATVRLESMEYDPENPLKPKKSDRPIVYKDGTRQETEALLTAATGGMVDGSPYKHMVDNIIDLGKSEVDVPLRVAWKILKQVGMGVTPAVRADHRKRRWLVREVPPEELAERKATLPPERKAARG